MLQARFIGSAVFGVVLTLIVFYLMFLLVGRADARPVNNEAIPTITFSPIEVPDTTTKKPPRQRPPEPNPQPPLPDTKIDMPQQLEMDVDLTDIEIPDIPGPGIITTGISDKFKNPGDGRNNGLTRLVYIAPVYPPSAAISGLEGWVRVAFTVEADGRVSAPRVVESQPPRVFDQAAIRAVLKWKFKPRQDNGQFQPQNVVQQIAFTLPDA